MSLICKIFSHSVKTIAVNDYEVPTHEKCERCNLERIMKRGDNSNCLHWHYSDGRVSVGYPVFRIDEVTFGETS